METTENNATSSPSSNPDTSLRRRSGRVVRAPRKFSPDANPSQSSQNGKSAPKRKRGPEVDDDEDEENEAPHGEQEPHGREASDQEDIDLEDEVEDDDDGDDDGDDGDDEPTPKPKKSKSSRNARPKKPAMKRAKVNGDAPTIEASALAPAAPAMKLPNRPKKTAKIALARVQDDGLYGKLPN